MRLLGGCGRVVFRPFLHGHGIAIQSAESSMARVVLVRGGFRREWRSGHSDDSGSDHTRLGSAM